jgi:hemerythrin
VASHTWQHSYETGNPTIDRQHRELIEFLDELRDVATGSQEIVLRVLDTVISFTQDHFASEEALMRHSRYPTERARAMVLQHDEFKSYARLRVLEFRQGEVTSVIPLQGFIEAFMTVHEFGMDVDLADWIRDQATVVED